MTACTDDERRRVAERLRRLNAPSLIAMMNILDVGGRDMCSRLADLIEPSEPKVKCVAEVKVDGEQLEKLVHDAAVELTGIDRDALLALADEMQGYADGAASEYVFTYLSAGSLWSYADRIREALGVCDG